MAKGDTLDGAVACKNIVDISYSPGGSTRREVGPGVHFGEGEVVRVSDSTFRKSDDGFL